MANQAITKPACGSEWAIVPGSPGSSQRREMARAAIGATWRSATELSVLSLATDAPVWAEYPHSAAWGWIASGRGRKAVAPIVVETRKFGGERQYRATVTGDATPLPQGKALTAAVRQRLDDAVGYLKRHCNGGAHPGGHTLAAIEAVPTIAAARAWLAGREAGTASRESAAPSRTLPRARRYWARLANPDRYRVEAAVSERDEGWWTTGQSEMLPGDGVIVWKGRGRKRGRGGVVAFGTVLTEPETRTDDDDPFWLDSERSRRPERRVLVRYELAQRLPLWADAPGNEALLGLSVARSRGRSVFRVTGEQWSEIAALAELTTERDSDGTAQVKRALSRMPDAARNAAVERRAMEEAARHYREAGWEVEDVSSRRGLGYDIRCTRNGEELHVEVKGVSADGSEVHLTRNEVEHAREYPRPVLFVVSGIEVSYADGGSPAASGGQARILDPWRIGDGELTALAYSYRLPADS